MPSSNIYYSDFYENWMKYLNDLTIEEFFKYKDEFECIKIIYLKSVSDDELELMHGEIMRCVEYIRKMK